MLVSASDSMFAFVFVCDYHAFLHVQEHVLVYGYVRYVRVFGNGEERFAFMPCLHSRLASASLSCYFAISISIYRAPVWQGLSNFLHQIFHVGS